MSKHQPEFDYEGMIDAVVALRSCGVVTVDRPGWRAWLTEHTVDGELDELGHAGYVLFAALSPDEIGRHYERHPEERERDQEIARQLLAERAGR